MMYEVLKRRYAKITASDPAPDLLVVDGDPSQDIALLQDRSKLKATVKGGAFVKDAL